MACTRGMRSIVGILGSDVAGRFLKGGRLAGEDSRTVRRDGLVDVGGDGCEDSREGFEERRGDVEGGGADHALVR